MTMKERSISIVFGNRSCLIRGFTLALGTLLGWLSATLPSAAHAQPQEVLRVSAVAERGPVYPGDQFAVAIVMDFAEGWHAWPNKPVLPPELGTDFDAIPTVIKFPGDAPAGWTVHTGFTQWPKPHGIVTSVTGTPIEILSYSDRSIAFVPVTLSAETKPGDFTLKFQVGYQACDDTTCLRFTTATAEVSISVVAIPASGTPPESKPSNPAMFKDFDGVVFAKIASGEPAPPDATPTPGAASNAAPGTDAASQPTNMPPTNTRPNLFGYELPAATSFLGVLVLFLASFLGGAILNLTPCVLPVIPIKVMTLSQHAGGSLSKTLILGFWMALGVTLFWVAIGVPMAVLGAAADPSRYIFGTWWITLSLGIIIVAAGLGIMGLFTFNLPQSLYMINPKADTAWGSFVFGIMTAVFGLPCFGLVAGGLLAIVASVPGIVTMVIFAGIGMGMAAPYLILAAFPKLMEKIPRTGPASELVKQVMGLLLLAAAAYFISGGIAGLLSAKPYLEDTIAWWAVAFFVLVASVWLTMRTFQIAKKTWPKIVMPIIAILGVLIFGGIADAMSQTAKIDYQKQLAARGSGGGSTLVPGTWVKWEPAHVEAARASGKIVIADFTARWCLNCKLWKAQFLDTDPVRSELVNNNVVMLKVELGDDFAPGWEWLRSFGRTGIPTVIVFEPGLKNPIIMNVYNSTTVMDALRKAKQAGATASLPPK